MSNNAGGFKKLPDSELAVMQAVWDLHGRGEDADAGALMRAKAQTVGRHKLTTVLTLLARLAEKGFISVEKRGRVNYYTPLVGEEEYKRGAATEFIRSVYGDSPLSLISALVDMGAVSADEIGELRKSLGE